MNRQMKRMQRRQGGTTVERAQTAAAARRSGGPGAGAGRTAGRASPRQFLKEVRQELKKVNWPTRQELVAYTVVVLVSVTVLTSFVFGLDFVFSKLVLNLFGNS